MSPPLFHTEPPPGSQHPSALVTVGPKPSVIVVRRGEVRNDLATTRSRIV